MEISIRHISIIGAGPAGCFLAILLKNNIKNIEVDVFDKSEENIALTDPWMRSIHLTLTASAKRC